MSNTVLVEIENHVAVITLNRPEKHNAINEEMRRAIAEAFENVRTDNNIRTVVLTGAGDRAFTAGADLIAMSQNNEQSISNNFWSPPHISGVASGYHDTFFKPVIAAVNGYCYADGVNILCQTTDIRIASETSTFCYAEILRGFSGAGPAIANLPRQVSYAKAMEWLLTGKVFDADEALHFGLVNEVVPLNETKTRAIELAHQISQLEPVAVRSLKEAIIRGLSMDLPNAVQFANSLSTLTKYTEDAKEGPKAFAEKRNPEFKGY